MSKIFPFVFVLLIWASCDSIDENFSLDSNLGIIFSSDTVSFDTLLTDTRSPTQRLTIYNPNNASLILNEVSLGTGENSDYSIIINGRPGDSQLNQEVLAGDSILILVEVNINPRNQNNPYLVKDSIIFNWNGNSEHVKLVSWGQDGTRIQNQSVCNVTWTNARPYIVSDTLLVPANCRLDIEPGTTIFFENDAVLFVQGTLDAVGDSANFISFQNARFDGIYNQVPGQWDGIYFLEGSTENRISYARISNGQVGLRVGTPDDDDIPDVVVSNTEIFNMSVAGILAFTSDVSATNCLIYNCGAYLVGNFAGGNYTYSHCTLSNDPSLFVSDEPSVQFSDNVIIGENQLLAADLNLELTNNIIWGSGDEELLINNGGEAFIQATLTSNIIRSGQDLADNFTSQQFNFPGFTSPFSADYSLDTLAFAKDQGTDIGVEKDILGATRDLFPDIGAYERIEKE